MNWLKQLTKRRTLHQLAEQDMLDAQAALYRALMDQESVAHTVQHWQGRVARLKEFLGV